MATITMDYKEFQEIKEKAEAKKKEIKEIAEKDFNKWKEFYIARLEKKIDNIKFYCDINQNIFGYINVNKILEEIEEIVEKENN
jgi:vacuolar-type H+-ATPase subunit E/Vma4